MASLNSLGQLRHLDRSSPDFHDQLVNILYGEEYKQLVPFLAGEDLVWVVEYLDEARCHINHSRLSLKLAQALDILDPASAGFRKCLRELRHICGVKMILPTSYANPSSLIEINHQPVASGGSCDLYEGTLNGSKVSVKLVRVYSKDGPGTAIQVCHPASPSAFHC